MMPLATIEVKRRRDPKPSLSRPVKLLAGCTLTMIVTSIIGAVKLVDAGREESGKSRSVHHIVTPGEGRVVYVEARGRVEYHTIDGRRFEFDRARIAWVAAES